MNGRGDVVGIVDSWEAPGYHGVDRRSSRQFTVDSPFDTSFLVAAGLVAMSAAVLGTLRWTAQTSARSDDVLGDWSAVLAVGLAVVAAGLAWLHWRQIGFAPSLWVASSLAVLGVFGIALAELLPPEADAWRPYVAFAGEATAVVLLARAASYPPVHARLRLWRVLALGVGSAAGLAVVLRLVASGVDALVAGDVASTGPGSAVLAAGWVAVAVLCIRRGGVHVRGAREFAWLGLVASTLALQQFGDALAGIRSPAEAMLDPLLALAMLLAVWGLSGQVHLAFVRQRVELLSVRVRHDQVATEVRAVRIEAEERAHEARNALIAIEGATRTLEQHRDTLPPETRAELAAAVAGEVSRLQHLISEEVTSHASFGVAESLAPVVTAARALGMDVDVDIAPDLVAFGDWARTAEAVQNLLENARRHAPGFPVQVVATATPAEVRVRVSDGGPGIPASERDSVFERGVRGRASAGVPGSGLGLHVSRRILRHQGGDLTLEDGDGPGATFVVTIPRPDGPVGVFGG